MFQHDNAQPHVATVPYTIPLNLNLPYSPAMLPTELVWDVLDRRVRQCVPVLANIQQLHTSIEVEEEWNNIPQATINSPINSM
jgi:hypothetical protein